MAYTSCRPWTPITIDTVRSELSEKDLLKDRLIRSLEDKHNELVHAASDLIAALKAGEYYDPRKARDIELTMLVNQLERMVDR